LAALPAGCARRVAESPGSSADAPLRFPGKVPMRLLNDRPPCLETPWRYFQEDLTPNEAFYVRWHLQFIPTTVDLRTWRLKVNGHVRQALELSLDELQQMKATSIVAVNQCSGNSRGLFDPPRTGAQWGNGAMGNARWTGVPLADLLDRAGVRDGAVDVSFAGLDRGGFDPIPDIDQSGYSHVPDFVKSLSKARAFEPEVLVAYQMNGEPLPMLNGFPVRLVVPGWYATYWVKALSEITVLPQPFKGYWMDPAYRIPATPNGVEPKDALAPKTVPINRMNVRSFFTGPERDSRQVRSRVCWLEGIAFDGGAGIRRVEVSFDGGEHWREAQLGDDLGRFSFRRWRLPWRPEVAGRARLRVRATNTEGETQPAKPGWNRAGYMRNVIEEWSVEVV
jgi:DMSO/TMAO reductase YedYZ molybdopterin-dependent catalytic subunit